MWGSKDSIIIPWYCLCLCFKRCKAKWVFIKNRKIQEKAQKLIEEEKKKKKEKFLKETYSRKTKKQK